MPTGLRERKNAAAKKAIFTAALDLFAQRGFEPVSVDAIAEKAGVSRTTFFNHFGSKEGVLRFFGQQLQQDLEELVDQVSPDAAPLQRLRDILEHMAEAAAASSDRLRLIYRYSLNDPAYLSGLTPARQRIWDLVTGIIAAGQELGQLRQDMPARELATHVLSLMNNATLFHVMGGAPIEPLIASTWKFILGGVLHADSATDPGHTSGSDNRRR
ncbi:MAG: TetR/AcrR family transcriptional regulator [Mycobacterium leprae]